MSEQIKSIRGMRDILPAESQRWQKLESLTRQVMHSYGYQEIRTPILEKTALFCRSIGDVTDIVEKEMYTFDDRNAESLSMRPENTASVVRACIQNSLLTNQIQRLWYTGPMFRYERPQKGRYRQFHQAGAEVFGLKGPVIEAELILLSARLWQLLGIQEMVTLEINTLGSPEDRKQYKDSLVNYFSQHAEQLDEDSQRRLHSNPLRILDSKNPAMQSLIESAPMLVDAISPASSKHFKTLCSILEQNNLAYKINPRLVRGLDYYSHTVFEWTTTQLGAQGTVCGGGRYDGLVEQLGAAPTPAVGFAMGLERLLALVEMVKNPTPATGTDIYLILAGDQAQQEGLILSEQLRAAFPDKQIIADCSSTSIKSQFKKADKSGAEYACIIGSNELESNTVLLKSLRVDAEQVSLKKSELIKHLSELFESKTFINLIH